MNDLFSAERPIRTQPELRHVLAHIWMAIEALSEDRTLDAQDNLKSIEGLIGMDGETDWESYYRKELEKWQKKEKSS